MRFKRSLTLATAFMAPFLLLFFPSTVFADSISSGIYYNTTEVVGNYWNSAGTYDDSMPEEDSGDTQGVFTYDDYDDTKYIKTYEIDGTIGSSADLYVYFYNLSTDSNGDVLSQNELGSVSVLQSQLGTKLSVPYSDCNGISITANVTDTSGDYGQFYLSHLWGDAFDLDGTPSNVQGDVSNGEVILSQPSWWESPTGDDVTTTTSTTADDDNITVNVTNNFPPAPDWNAIEQGIADDIVGDIPPIPPPPSGSDQITANPTVTPPTMVNPPDLVTPPVTDIPSDPPETSPGTWDFSDTNDQNAIPVPTSDSKPFTIPDPMSGLPYTTGIPIPGSSPGTSLVPNTPSSPTPTPQPQTSAGDSGPTPTPPTGDSLPIPGSGTATTGSTPSPSDTGTSTPTPDTGGNEPYPSLTGVT